MDKPDPKNYELIITEKPRASEKISQALAEKKILAKKLGAVTYYLIERGKKKIIVASAVGHIFTLKEDKGAFGYPLFDVEWTPSYKANKYAAYTKSYADALKKLAKGANSFVSACDYDIEGELIGYNVLKFLCGEEALKKARRMKFSTLTQEELEKSYDTALPHIDFNLADAGVARHTLDWFWGINTSRALSYAYKSISGRDLILSAGRVQTPTLKILGERENEIQKFAPTPFWVITALIKINKETIPAIHEKEKFTDENEAASIYNSCKGKGAIAEKISFRRFEQKPPAPFNLGDLQLEAYRFLHLTPQRTQQVSQALYEAGLISYPRTSSQKLAGIDSRAIIAKLSRIAHYRPLAAQLLQEKELIANEGSKTDPAHPCIYPTGEKPKTLQRQELMLYDLIVKRFFATFGKPAVRETQTILLKIGNETFVIKGSRTVEKNWYKLYEPYSRQKEDELPKFSEGKSYKVKEIKNERKETQPPSRYNAASVVKKMEDLGIGTKSTRALILQTLYDRGYITGAQIKVTSFGEMIVNTLVEYVPELTSEQLTKTFEENLEQIQEGKIKKETVVETAKQMLIEILQKFKANEQHIGEKLVKSYSKTRAEQSLIGKCPNCKSDLIIRVSKKTHKQFIGCSSYPKCTTGFPLPQSALIVKTEKLCPHDNLPVIQVVRKGKRRFEMCISHLCKSKESWKPNPNFKKAAEPKKVPAAKTKKQSQTVPHSSKQFQP